MSSLRNIIAVFALFAMAPAWAEFNASLDRAELAPGETVQLTLERDGSNPGEPDVTPLKQDFDILGTSSGSNVQIVNGHYSAQARRVLTLAPRRAGNLRVPALRWGDESSPVLALRVGADAGGARSKADAAHVFITSTVDEKQPYVGGAALLTVQLHTDQMLDQASLDLQSSDDVLVQQVGEDRQTQEVREGRRYQLIERQYLVLPQRSGQLELGGPVLNAQVRDRSDPFGGNSLFDRAFGGTGFGGLLGATRPMRLRGDPIELNVQPRPSQWNGRDWFPARHVTLAASSKPEAASVHAGEPLTLHLQLSAGGVAATQLPDLAAQLILPDGLKAYPDQARLDTTVQDGRLSATSERDIALIANRPGRYEIPGLRLAWWDVEARQQRIAELPAQTLEVLPAVGSVEQIATAAPSPLASAGPTVAAVPASPVPNAEVAAEQLPWRALSFALAILWLTTLATWWWSRYRSKRVSTPEAAVVAAVGTPGVARREFQQACRGNDAHAARRALLVWAKASGIVEASSGLQVLVRNFDDAATVRLLQELDRACYAGGANWSGAALAQALTTLPRATRAAVPVAGVPALYP